MNDKKYEEQVIDNPITVLPGKLGAPLDYKLLNKNLNILGNDVIVPTIEQHNSTNCAEYSILQAAILAKALGFRTSQELNVYLEGKSTLKEAIDEYERGFVLHILGNAHKRSPEGYISASNLVNLRVKNFNIYAPLDGTNSMLLFTSVFKGLEDLKFEESIYFDKAVEDMINNEKALVIFEGDSEKGHATTRLIAGNHAFAINTSRHGNVISITTKQEAIEHYKTFLNGNNYILIHLLQNE
jgi:hypothetical protein